MEKKKPTPSHEMRDREVPPVKGAVTDLEDVLRKPTAIFGPAHPIEYADKANPLVLDHLQ